MIKHSMNPTPQNNARAVIASLPQSDLGARMAWTQPWREVKARAVRILADSSVALTGEQRAALEAVCE